MSPGTARSPRSKTAGLDLHRAYSSSKAGDTMTRVALRLEQGSRPPGLVLAGHEHGERAAPLGRHVLELEVLDVDLLGAERLRDARENAGPVGHVHADALKRADVVVGLVQQRAAGCRPPRRSSARANPRRLPRARARAPRPGDGARPAPRGAPPRCRGRCRSRCAGSHPPPASCRGATRRRPRAARGRSTRTEPAWLRIRFASACGRWLVSARSRSCAAGSIATGIAPSEATKPCRSW